MSTSLKICYNKLGVIHCLSRRVDNKPCHEIGWCDQNVALQKGNAQLSEIQPSHWSRDVTCAVYDFLIG